jgi:hypothetical protein
MTQYEKTIHLYDDGIGRVQYISHMGDDITSRLGSLLYSMR